MLIAMAGLPGTGKSTLAHHLAHALAAIVLDKDVIRAALFPPAWVEYSTEQDDFCMSVMFRVSAYSRMLQYPRNTRTHIQHGGG
jgi:predicted kinase